MSVRAVQAKHTRKPQVDVGALYKVLEQNCEILKDMGPYEHVSRNGKVEVKGIVHCLGLARGLIKLSPCGEIHGQVLRTGLLKLLSQQPALNGSKYNGIMWSNLRAERICTFLNRCRKLARTLGKGDEWVNVIAKLKSKDALQVQGVMEMVQLQDAAEQHSEQLQSPVLG